MNEAFSLKLAVTSINPNNIMKRMWYAPDQKEFYFCGSYALSAAFNYFNSIYEEFPEPPYTPLLHPKTQWDHRNILDKSPLSPKDVIGSGCTLEELSNVAYHHFKENTSRMGGCIRMVKSPKEDMFTSDLSKLSDNSVVIICNYHRGIINGTDVGHFSIIAGYHEEKQMVLVADGSRYNKYEPKWIPLKMMLAAMSEKERGYVSIQFKKKECESVSNLDYIKINSCYPYSRLGSSTSVWEYIPLLPSDFHPSDGDDDPEDEDDDDFMIFKMDSF